MLRSATRRPSRGLLPFYERDCDDVCEDEGWSISMIGLKAAAGDRAPGPRDAVTGCFPHTGPGHRPRWEGLRPGRRRRPQSRESTVLDRDAGSRFGAEGDARAHRLSRGLARRRSPSPVPDCVDGPAAPPPPPGDGAARVLRGSGQRRLRPGALVACRLRPELQSGPRRAWLSFCLCACVHSRCVHIKFCFRSYLPLLSSTVLGRADRAPGLLRSYFSAKAKASSRFPGSPRSPTRRLD